MLDAVSENDFLIGRVQSRMAQSLQRSQTLILERELVPQSKSTESNEKKDDDDDDVQVISANQSVRCPLTFCVMKEPVRSIVCGHVFERSAVFQYIANEGRKVSSTNAIICPVFGCSNYMTTNCFRTDSNLMRQIKERMTNENKDGDGRTVIDLLEDYVETETLKSTSDSESDIEILPNESMRGSTDSGSDIEILSSVERGTTRESGFEIGMTSSERVVGMIQSNLSPNRAKEDHSPSKSIQSACDYDSDLEILPND